MDVEYSNTDLYMFSPWLACIQFLLKYECHDDVIKWKKFPRYWPFVRGIHRTPDTGEFPVQRPVPQSFDVFFDLCLKKRLSKQSWGWWFETPSRSLWRHCNSEAEGQTFGCKYLYNKSLYFSDHKILKQVTCSPRFVWKAGMVSYWCQFLKLYINLQCPRFNLNQHLHLRQHALFICILLYAYTCIHAYIYTYTPPTKSLWTVLLAVDSTLTLRLFQQVAVRKPLYVNQPNQFCFKGHILYC